MEKNYLMMSKEQISGVEMKFQKHNALILKKLKVGRVVLLKGGL